MSEARGVLRVDPYDDISKLNLDLTKLSVLWVHPQVNMGHGIDDLFGRCVN